MRKNFLKTTLLTGGIFFFIIIFHFFGWLKIPENALRKLFTPFLKNSHEFNIRVGENYEFFKNKEAFFVSYNQCTSKASLSENLEVENKLLVQENKILKQQLAFTEGLKTKIITTSVIGNDILGTEKTIILNSGEEQGVAIGNPVISGPGFLVGKIIVVQKSTSIAQLITHYQSKFQASSLNKDESLGVVEGGYGANLRMKFVPRNETININDQIITSGFEKNIPRGLIIGRVIEVENEAYQGFQKITILPSASLSKLTLVSILTVE